MKSGMFERGATASDCTLASRDDEETARFDRLAQMIGSIRMVEHDLRAITPADRDAHAYRLARAHALALVDLLVDLAAAH